MSLFKKKTETVPEPTGPVKAVEVWKTCVPCNGMRVREVWSVPKQTCPDCNGRGEVLA